MSSPAAVRSDTRPRLIAICRQSALVCPVCGGRLEAVSSIHPGGALQVQCRRPRKPTLANALPARARCDTFLLVAGLPDPSGVAVVFEIYPDEHRGLLAKQALSWSFGTVFVHLHSPQE